MTRDNLIKLVSAKLHEHGSPTEAFPDDEYDCCAAEAVDVLFEALFPRIRTEEELDALPDMTVVRSMWGVIWERVKDSDGARDYWIQPDSANHGGRPALPARVILREDVIDLLVVDRDG